MEKEIYTRKRMARIAAVLSFVVCSGMLIRFLHDYPGRLTGASGRTMVYGIVAGALVLGFICTCFYAAFRVFRPILVEGILSRVNGKFVSREKSNLVIHVGGGEYRFPIDRDLEAKLNEVRDETIRVRMEIGAFHYALCLTTISTTLPIGE